LLARDPPALAIGACSSLQEPTPSTLTSLSTRSPQVRPDGRHPAAGSFSAVLPARLPACLPARPPSSHFFCTACAAACFPPACLPACWLACMLACLRALTVAANCPPPCHPPVSACNANTANAGVIQNATADCQLQNCVEKAQVQYYVDESLVSWGPCAGYWGWSAGWCRRCRCRQMQCNAKLR